MTSYIFLSILHERKDQRLSGNYFLFFYVHSKAIMIPYIVLNSFCYFYLQILFFYISVLFAEFYFSFIPIYFKTNRNNFHREHGRMILGIVQFDT